MSKRNSAQSIDGYVAGGLRQELASAAPAGLSGHVDDPSSILLTSIPTSLAFHEALALGSHEGFDTHGYMLEAPFHAIEVMTFAHPSVFVPPWRLVSLLRPQHTSTQHSNVDPVVSCLPPPDHRLYCARLADDAHWQCSPLCLQ